MSAPDRETWYLTDREVHERLLVAIGCTGVVEGFGGSFWAYLPHPHDLERCPVPSRGSNQ